MSSLCLYKYIFFSHINVYKYIFWGPLSCLVILYPVQLLSQSSFDNGRHISLESYRGIRVVVTVAKEAPPTPKLVFLQLCCPSIIRVHTLSHSSLRFRMIRQLDSVWTALSLWNAILLPLNYYFYVYVIKFAIDCRMSNCLIISPPSYGLCWKGSFIATLTSDWAAEEEGNRTTAIFTTKFLWSGIIQFDLLFCLI